MECTACAAGCATGPCETASRPRPLSRDQAKRRAETAGVRATHSLDYAQSEIDAHLDGLFGKYEEHVLDSAARCGFSITLAQIDSR